MPSKDLYRTPPHNVDAERAVLSAIILRPANLDVALQHLTPGDFYQIKHQRILKAMTELSMAGSEIDIITVSDKLKSTRELDEIGGSLYLAELQDEFISDAYMNDHVRIVHEKATMRALILATANITTRCYDEHESVPIFIQEAERVILEASQVKSEKTILSAAEGVVQAMAQMDAVQKNAGKMSGIPSGFVDLDHLTDGFQKKDLIILAARPGVGKTALAMNIAEYAASLHIPVGVFSLEMGTTQLIFRLISAKSKVPSSRLRNGRLEGNDYDKLGEAIGHVSQLPLYIDDVSAQTLTELRAKARIMKRDHKIELLIIDYLQLMQSGERAENRNLEVGQITRRLKMMARELDLPIILLSQLNRQLESRGDKRPGLADLRDCVTGNTLVLLNDGRRVPISELEGTTPEVLAVNENGKIVTAKSEKIWKVGIRPVLKICLASGRSITATATHRLFGATGWKKIAELSTGDRVAIVRHFPEPHVTRQWSEERLALLGQMIGDGSYIEGAPSRKILLEYADLLNDEDLRKKATSDLFWDKIISIEPHGEEEVFDLTVPGPKSWLADGVLSHNSGAIEADSDIVLFLYRESLYAPTAENARTAELIIGKHRNGALATIPLIFTPETTEFQNGMFVKKEKTIPVTVSKADWSEDSR